MTLNSNDPSWWPSIEANRIFSYIIVASSAGVIYDWALTFGQEIELIWRQRCSLMTVLYLSVRYVGILYAVVQILIDVPTISETDVVSLIMSIAIIWMSLVVNVILGVIMIARLNAMYQRSRKVLITLIAVFLAVYIAVGLLTAIRGRHSSGDELILSGTHQCAFDEGGGLLLFTTAWILGIVWEVVALCFAVWIAVKHFRELRQYSAGGIVGDCFAVLMKTHLVYFVSYVAVSCFQLGYLSPKIVADPYSLEYQLYYSFSQIFLLVQLFVLGPRLILGIREYHAKLVADSDSVIGMTPIAFQERVHVSTSSSV
ncbi:hypothetical protein BDR05DRAFT_1060708 [Suillus weaverae]|nr:hypothetical protein BDR05DRAFT_1060708 [Suillus weaverae]